MRSSARWRARLASGRENRHGAGRRRQGRRDAYWSRRSRERYAQYRDLPLARAGTWENTGDIFMALNKDPICEAPCRSPLTSGRNSAALTASLFALCAVLEVTACGGNDPSSSGEFTGAGGAESGSTETS